MGAVAIVAALWVVVIPAIGAVGEPIPPPSSPGNVTPIEVATGGQSNDCALFNTTGLSLSQYRIDNPKTQTYTTQVDGRTVTFALVVAATGRDKDKLLDFQASGALVYYVGVKGGSNTAKYDYTAAPRTADGQLHAPLDNQGKLYSVSNTTFCFATAASISGTVFDDADGDGVKDAGEGGIAGATVTAFDGAVVAGTATTTGSGGYSLSNLAVGKTYTVCQSPLAGSWTRTLPVSATPGSAACADGTRGYADALTTSVSGRDFGNVQTASIAGRVFDDLDADGSADAGEGGLTGQTVTLRRSGSADRVASLAADGSFTLSGVPVGSGYTLCVAGSSALRQTVPVSPAGTGCATEGTRGYAIDLAGSGSSGNVFGFVRVATVSGVIFGDANVNGVQDAGEGGIAGRNVFLYKAGALVDTEATSGSGSFSFGSQDVGAAYKVCVAEATGQAQTYPQADTEGSAACDAEGETAVGWGFTLTTDGKTNLGFGSVAAIIGSCADPFGDEDGYKIQLAGGPPDPCDKAFVYAYDDTTAPSGGLASLVPVPSGANPNTYAMVEKITWTIPGDGQQFDIQYDDVAPYLSSQAAPMLYCKLDPRVSGEEFDLQSAYFSTDFGGNPSAVLPAGQTSCIINEEGSTGSGTYVVYVYSSIDGLRVPNG